jgi:predicted nucleic acid-binding protein
LRAVLDAGPLIRLAQTGLLDKIRVFYDECLVPRAVYDEVVVGGLEKGYGDARVSKAAVDGGSLVVGEAPLGSVEAVKRVEERLGVQLGAGEREGIALARDSVFITDDETAYQVARALGTEARGSLYLLLRMVSEGLISSSEASAALNEMIEAGFWLSPRLVHEFHNRLSEMKPS